MAADFEERRRGSWLPTGASNVRLEAPAERLRYAEQAIAGGWSHSTLEANIRDKLLDRGK